LHRLDGIDKDEVHFMILAICAVAPGNEALKEK